MIDLHLHTTASDGRLAPDALVARAAGLGLTVISVTDHDTTAGLAEAADAGARATACAWSPASRSPRSSEARDVHVLGYFFDPDACRRCVEFLRAQREDRRRRVETMVAAAGATWACRSIATQLLASVTPGSGRAIGRPHVADALVAAGHAARSWRCLRPVPRRTAGRRSFRAAAPSVGEVAAIVRAAGGVASLAHPGLDAAGPAIRGFVAGGLPAIEVWHSDHDAAADRALRAAGAALGLGRVRRVGFPRRSLASCVRHSAA